MATGKKIPTIESKALSIAIKRAMATRELKVKLYLVAFRFGLPECLEIRKRWYFNAFAILQVVTGYDCMERNVTVFVCGLYAE